MNRQTLSPDTSIALLPEDPVSALGWEVSRSATTGHLDWRLWLNQDQASPVPSLDHDNSRESTPDDPDLRSTNGQPAEHQPVAGVPEPSRTSMARGQTALAITSAVLSAWSTLKEDALRTASSDNATRIEISSVSEAIPRIYYRCRSFIDIGIDHPVEAEDGPFEGSTSRPTYDDAQMRAIKDALATQGRGELPHWPADLADRTSLVERAMPFVAATLHNLQRCPASATTFALSNRVDL